MVRDVRAAGLAAFIVLTKSPANGSKIFLSIKNPESRIYLEQGLTHINWLLSDAPTLWLRCFRKAKALRD